MKKLLFLSILFLCSGNLYAAGSHFNYDDIKQIDICYENKNFEINRMVPWTVLPPVDLGVVVPNSDTLIITNQDKHNNVPVFFSVPDAELRLYSYTYTEAVHQNLYAVVVTKNSLIENPCSGIAEHHNTSFLIENIPENHRLLFIPTRIPIILASDPNVIDGEVMDSNLPRRIEPVDHSGIPSVPNGFNPSFHPGGNSPGVVPANPPANDEENTPSLVPQSPASNDQGLENNPNKFPSSGEGAVSTPPIVAKDIGGHAEGCSLQLNGNSMANFSWGLWSFVLASFTVFRKRK